MRSTLTDRRLRKHARRTWSVHQQRIVRESACVNWYMCDFNSPPNSQQQLYHTVLCVVKLTASVPRVNNVHQFDSTQCRKWHHVERMRSQRTKVNISSARMPSEHIAQSGGYRFYGLTPLQSALWQFCLCVCLPVTLCSTVLNGYTCHKTIFQHNNSSPIILLVWYQTIPTDSPSSERYIQVGMKKRLIFYHYWCIVF